MTVSDIKRHLNTRIEELEHEAFQRRNDASSIHEELRAVVEELKDLRDLVMRPESNPGAI